MREYDGRRGEDAPRIDARARATATTAVDRRRPGTAASEAQTGASQAASYDRGSRLSPDKPDMTRFAVRLSFLGAVSVLVLLAIGLRPLNGQSPLRHWTDAIDARFTI